MIWIAPAVVLALTAAIWQLNAMAALQARETELRTETLVNRARANVMNAGCDAAERGDVDDYYWSVARVMASRGAP